MGSRDKTLLPVILNKGETMRTAAEFEEMVNKSYKSKRVCVLTPKDGTYYKNPKKGEHLACALSAAYLQKDRKKKLEKGVTSAKIVAWAQKEFGPDFVSGVIDGFDSPSWANASGWYSEEYKAGFNSGVRMKNKWLYNKEIV